MVIVAKRPADINIPGCQEMHVKTVSSAEREEMKNEHPPQSSTVFSFQKSHLVLVFNPRNSYIGNMKVKITERIAFHIGVLYGFLKAKLILCRKEIK